MAPARQAGEGSVRLTAFVAGVSDEGLLFHANGTGSASTSTTGTLFSSQSGSDVDAQGGGSQLFFKLSAQPFEGFEYSLIGGLGHYGVKVPSASATSDLTGDRVGTTVGAGIRWTMVPDTLVTPAAALDVSALHSQFSLTRLDVPGAGGQNVDERLTLDRLQAALVLSKRWGSWEPYGGVKWLRTFAKLKDLSTSETAGGTKDATIPFLGARFKAFERESLVAEAAFTNGFQVGGGVEIKFK